MTAQQDGGTVTVTDCLLDTPHHFISTDMQNQDTNVVNNAIFAVDMQKFVGWDLKAGGIAQGGHDNLRAVVNEILVTDSDMEHLALSHNCSWIAFTTKQGFFLYDVKTQKAICGNLDKQLNGVKFPLCEHQVWSIKVDRSNRFATLVIGPIRVPKTFFHWDELLLNLSPLGNFVCDGHSSEWVVGFKHMKSLWLPPAWRKEVWHKLRGGRKFLASLGPHQEPIVIEFCYPSLISFSLDNPSDSLL